ncbi:hypothetical protein EC973_007317 [Apophysomyces ossiformis]|uniref:Kinase-like protein n=1 Tax=Apophysomyces ossiformis TaxID=679940 RepID=A0A8H7BPZ6_9FUNG|nr:hypothetical protein EC973_007317 [Apophysomyces ossiformis]
MGAVCCHEEHVDLEGEVDLAHFTLLRSVGKGAFGKVRVVQHKGNKQLYALKYINKAKCIQMRAVENIISERRLLEQINCGLIVNLRYAFQDDENLFMILDLMLGGDLRFHLDRLGVMPEEYVRFYAAEVAISLRYLHKKNIVHRDLKPDNILLNEHGHAHLTDFNIAVQFSEKKPLTSVAGSMAYMAPEVLQKRGYFASVDWWSLGVVCFELLFGKRPFRGKSNDALQQAILREPVKFPENSRVSGEAIDLIKGLLTRDIKQRLGVDEAGFQRLQNHPWFKGIDWFALEAKEAQPPFVPDNKRANFDPTHELEEILLEDHPLKVRKRNPKRSQGSHAKTSQSNASELPVSETSPERQMMEDKFLTFDFTKPDENEKRKKELEQKRWAQKMSKTNGEKHGIYATGYASTRKAAGTYKASVLDYINQKPTTPLSAGDILKLEELARMARAGVGKDRAADWRPPSGILSHSPPDGKHPLDAVQARDDYIIQAGGVPPPARPPPPLKTSNDSVSRHDGAFGVEKSQDAVASSQVRYRRRSSDASYQMASSPENSDRPLMATGSSSGASNIMDHKVSMEPDSPPEWMYDPRTLPPIPASTDEDRPVFSAPKKCFTSPPHVRPVPKCHSSISRNHSTPLPPPTSLPPPIPTSLPSLPITPSRRPA